MPWNLLSTTPPPPDGDESWKLITLPPVVGIISYGFRMRVPTSTPPNWGTGGYWGIAQEVANALVVSRQHPIPLMGRGAFQALRAITSGDSTLITQQNTALYLTYSQHKWIASEGMELWALVP